ncbi:MAG: hypothetical protein CMB41_05790 [Euryarchaeota archaeon]|jgi:archaellum component FlaG (FlaF/FlaG flagellin family)|nr:hypothetical protein [Euryarchaeota archaeon]|tara:strand:+ start:2862 stop:3344 length:483 start_codon:yes stop_codon:yes gene_type:complete
MADGGATSFIMLVTALLVAGSVSTFLIAEWGDVARSMEMERRAQAIDAETDVSLAGDPGHVRYSLTGQIQFYLMNSGTSVLDDSTLVVLVDGVQQTANVTTTVMNGGDWSAGELLQVQVVDNTLTYANNTEVVLTVVVSSEFVSNVRGTDTLDAEVRLVV